MARVLVVDDEEIIRSTLSACLATTFDVWTAENGRVALDHVRERSFDVIVLDLEMPDVDGSAFLREFRAQGHAGQILICSGADNAEVRAARLGADGMLAKPFDSAVLRAKVAAMLNEVPSSTQRTTEVGANRRVAR